MVLFLPHSCEECCSIKRKYLILILSFILILIFSNIFIKIKSRLGKDKELCKVSFITPSVSAEIRVMVSLYRAFPHDLWFSASGWPQ